MKKFLIGLAIFLVVFIVLPAGFVFIFLFDTGKMPVDYNENFNKDDWAKALVVDSLDNTATTQTARFEVSENDINNFIHTALAGNDQFNKYVTQLAVDITEDSYVVSISGKLSFFETRAQLKATLEKMIVSSNGFEEEAYVLKVENITLGRLSHIKEVALFFMKQFLNNDSLDALATNLKVHTDLQNSCIFIYASDLRELINTAVTGEGAGQTAFFLTFINDFLNQGLLEFDFYGGDKFSVVLKLDKLTGNDYGVGEYVAYKMPYENTTTKIAPKGHEKKLSLDSIREAVVTLLDASLIQEADMSAVADYLFNGYDSTNPNAPSCDLSSIGILNKTTYPGFKDIYTQTSIDNILTSRVVEFPDYSDSLNSFELADIKESDINEYLKSQHMLGIKYFLERSLDTGAHKANYIALDNAYINLLSNKAIITAGLNVNGLETTVTLPMVKNETESSGSALVYDSEPLYYGATPESGEPLTLAPETETLIFNTLKDSIKDDSFIFLEGGKLKIDFAAIISNQLINSIDTGNPIYDAAYKAFLNNAHYEVSVVGDAVELNSSIKLVANRA